MADFHYQEPYPVQQDKTAYRKISSEFVHVEKCGDREVLRIDPKALEILAQAAMSDVSFYLRPTHLTMLNTILQDPEATDNDRFVAYNLLQNAVVAAEGQLPSCQDTGTAIVMAKKGEDVYTGVDDAEYLSKGIFNTYQERNLRYSQVVALNMFEEKIPDPICLLKLIFMQKKEISMNFFSWRKVAVLPIKLFYTSRRNPY
jgi:fumarate hydratase class I